MDNEGYILLHRKMIGWEWFSDANTLTVFIHCLLNANWRDGRFQGKEVKRGSFITSIAKLSEETGLTMQNVRTALKHLESTGELTSKSQAKYRIITVSKYDDYQCTNKVANKQLTSSQQAANNNRIKEINKEYILSISSSKDSDIDCPTETVRPAQKHSEDIKRILEAWNTLSSVGISAVSRVNPGSKRYINLVARINEYGTDDVLKAITEIHKSKFLQGHNNRGWVITFDWFLLPSNFPKVLEGNYNKEKGVTRDFSWLDDDSE